MSRFFYSLAFYLLLPLIVLRLLYRSIKEPGYRQAIGERFGFYRTEPADNLIWIHAVSAGETVAVAPLVKRLVSKGYPCLVTNMTPTGRERVRELLGDTVSNCYAPYDLPDAVHRFLLRNKPKLMMTVDTELWPNTLHLCRQQGVKTLLVNGRLSAKSAAGYARFSVLSKPMLQAMDCFAVQTSAHAKRFEALGVSAARISVAGSIKFDGDERTGYKDRRFQAERLAGDRPMLLAASTHAGEELAMLECLASLRSALPEVLLVLAPRHPHRTDQVVRLCQRFGQSPVLLTAAKPVGLTDQVLLIDKMGELDAFFPMARVAFVGGSLVPIGGHNLLEAVQAKTAVVMGPHLRNIEDIAQQFIDAQAMKVVVDASDLTRQVQSLMLDASRREQMVTAASKVFERNRGALDLVYRMAEKLLESGRAAQ